MELCLDNPREGFSDLFATHPSVDSRVQALVKYAGGHDPGPLALPAPVPDASAQPPDGQVPPALPEGPWGAHPAGAPQATPEGMPPEPIPGPWSNSPGPWGRH
jgi:heat shock protein HtpX